MGMKQAIYSTNAFGSRVAENLGCLEWKTVIEKSSSQKVEYMEEPHSSFQQSEEAGNTHRSGEMPSRSSGQKSWQGNQRF